MSTYVLIEKYTVGAGGVSSVTLGSGGTIPQTYTDLVVRVSVRTGRGYLSDALYMKFNGSSTGYTNKDLTYDNGGVSSYTDLFGVGYSMNTQGNAGTASVFSNQEIYIPNYAGNSNKSVSTNSVVENNGTDARVEMSAFLWSNTAAITSITFTNNSATNFAQYSTFYLYGILKA